MKRKNICTISSLDPSMDLPRIQRVWVYCAGLSIPSVCSCSVCLYARMRHMLKK